MKENQARGYVSNFTAGNDDFKSESGLSTNMRSNRKVADRGLSKLLQDPSISENERMAAVKARTEQIEQKAQMEEQKLRLNKPSGGSYYQ